MTEARTEGAGIVVVDRAPLTNTLVAGAAAGVVGALLMAAWAMALAAVTGYGAWFPFKMIGATFVGPTALVGGLGTVLYGWALHVLVSIAFAIVFALGSRWTASYGGALLSGVAYSLGVMLIMTYVVVAVANAILLQRIALTPASWFFMHVLYGAGLSSTPWLLRRSRAIVH
jgi:hypothetical protein